MGISLAYLAVRGLSPDGILARLEVRRSGAPSTSVSDELTAGPLPSGWFLVTALGCDHRIIMPETMARLSKDCEAVACSIEEHVNFSFAEHWQNGARLWHVSHEGAEDPEEVHHEGAVPARFHTLVDTADDEDPEGHGFFEIALILSHELTGYRYDVDEPEGFEQLADLRARTPAAAWWRRWLERVSN